MSFRDITPEDVKSEGVVLAELTCHGCEDTVIRIEIYSIEEVDAGGLLQFRATRDGWKYDEDQEILVCKKCVDAEE